MTELILIAVAYLMGSIPTGVIISSYLGGKDVTKEGSGNIGATNVGRVVGKKAGLFTLLGDTMKGVVPVVLALIITGSPVVVSAVALAAFLGHIFPIFNDFKGGKGVATALGIFLIISPASALTAVLIFAFFLYTWRYVSLGSIVAAGTIPALMGIFAEPRSYIVLSLIIGGFVIYRHRDNIRRLLDGDENRLGQKREEPMEEELE